MDYELKIKDLISKMTVREKLGQLNQLGGSIYGRVDESGFEALIASGEVGSFLSSQGAQKTNKYQRIAMEKSRLKIPVLFAHDVIHGIKTIFPTPLAESCSWDLSLAERTAQMAAREATALGIKWTFAPMVDIARDSRWGRIIEGSGEDTYLGGLLARARVSGFQGNEMPIAKDRMAACLKHYVAYGAAEGGKDYNTVQLSDYNLNNVYFPPFKEGVDAGALTVMTSFNDLNGTPCSANEYTINTVLKKLWKFNGLIVSDWNSIVETIAHGYSLDMADAAANGMNSGISMDMAGECYINHGEELIKCGKVKLETVDALVAEVLRIKFALNLFDNPYTDENLEKTEVLTDEAFALSLEAGEKSIVLLKNKNDTLPIKQNKKVLLVGKLATSNAQLHGSWAPSETHPYTMNILDGLSKRYDITYIEGYDLDSCDENQMKQIEKASTKADIIIATVGESVQEAGEAHSKSVIELRENHENVLRRLHKLNKPLVALLINGRPLALTKAEKYCDAIVEGWQLGSRTGEAVAKVLSGEKNPQGRLTATFPRASGQCPLYYSHFSSGRPYSKTDGYTSHYMDCGENGLYNFGFGLSYTDFSYSSVQLNKNKFKKDEIISVSLKIKNIGKREGVETVQVYGAPRFSKPIRPVSSLVGFTQVDLKPEEERLVIIEIPVSRLGFYADANLVKRTDEGKYVIMVGKDSQTFEKIDIEVE